MGRLGDYNAVIAVMFSETLTKGKLYRTVIIDNELTLSGSLEWASGVKYRFPAELLDYLPTADDGYSFSARCEVIESVIGWVN